MAIFLCLHVIWGAERADEDTLASALSAALGVKVTRSADNNIILEGSQAELEHARGILSDLPELRKHFLPVSSHFTNVTGVKERIASWSACFKALGIDERDVRLVNIEHAIDTGTELAIPTDSEINSGIANLYVDALKKRSAFFNWVCVNLKEFVRKSETDTGTHLVIHYDLLNQFLFMEEMKIDAPVALPGSDEHIGLAAVSADLAAADVLPVSEGAAEADVLLSERRLVVPAPSVLRHLIAAGSGDITLEPVPGKPGEYWFRTISLGRDLARGSARSILDVAIDVSGSMDEVDLGDVKRRKKIQVVNEQVPCLLKQFRDTLKSGTELLVRVHSFADDIRYEGDFLLASGKPIAPWKNLETGGGTDLTLVAKMIPSQAEDEPRVVVGFTDGQHTSSSSLLKSIADLNACQSTGHFARPRLCRVGPKTTESDKFFGGISDIFAGAFDEHQTIGSFCDRLSADAPGLLQVKAPVVLNLSGTKVVLWQPNEDPGLYRAPRTVQAGSVITHHGVTATVDVGAAVAVADVPVDPRLARIAALKAELAHLEGTAASGS